jgi:hypothetical protein
MGVTVGCAFILIYVHSIVTDYSVSCTLNHTILHALIVYSCYFVASSSFFFHNYGKASNSALPR